MKIGKIVAVVTIEVQPTEVAPDLGYDAAPGEPANGGVPQQVEKPVNASKEVLVDATN